LALSYTGKFRANEANLRVGLFIYDDLNEAILKHYWAELLEIPEKQFIKTQVLKSKSTLTNRKSKHGICSLYFSSTELSVKIREWIILFQESILHKDKRD
jgi:hypothetical protein